MGTCHAHTPSPPHTHTRAHTHWLSHRHAHCLHRRRPLNAADAPPHTATEASSGGNADTTTPPTTTAGAAESHPGSGAGSGAGASAGAGAAPGAITDAGHDATESQPQQQQQQQEQQQQQQQPSTDEAVAANATSPAGQPEASTTPAASSAVTPGLATTTPTVPKADGGSARPPAPRAPRKSRSPDPSAGGSPFDRAFARLVEAHAPTGPQCTLCRDHPYHVLCVGVQWSLLACPRPLKNPTLSNCWSRLAPPIKCA